MAMPELVAVKIFHDLAKGLQACHAKKIVHCDVKTDNCLIGGDLTVKLADFGISLFADTDGEKTKHKIGGTPGWKSPEACA